VTVDRWATTRAIAAVRFATWETSLRAAIGHELDTTERATIGALRTTTAAMPLPDEARTLAERLAVAVRARGSTVFAKVVAAVDGMFPDLNLPPYDLTGRLERLDYLVAEMGADTTASIDEALTRGANLGESIPKLSARVRQAAGVGRSRGTLIARTEVVGASNEIAMDRAQFAARTGLALWKTWLATSDTRTRPDHVHANGQTVPLDQDFTVGGFAMAHPGDGSAPAREVCNCRCTVIFSESPDGP
jgi:uncharacterized protein with gpF-like domain